MRASKRAQSYRDISDRVTAKNWGAIQAEAEKRNSYTSNDETVYCGKGKNGTANQNGTLNEAQFRASENYRRRIYDALAVLRASSIIVPIEKDSRYFVYNQRALGPKRGAMEAQAKQKVTQERIRDLMMEIKKIDTRCRQAEIESK